MAFDAGWPCTFYEYQRMMKTLDLNFKDLKWCIVSHMHMDHAGLLGEFIQKGVECYCFENQFAYIESMERIIAKNREYKDYVPIERDRLKQISVQDFDKKLNTIGIKGKVIFTIGHSPDSITYVTEQKEALIGDLPPLDQVMEDDYKSLESWKAVREHGVKNVFPSHAQPFLLY